MSVTMSQTSLQIGAPAPELNIPDQTGTERTLAEYRGRWVLLYFYPKDDTPGCTTEACTLRDNLPKLQGLNAVVLGVSKDTVKSHARFAEKYGLPFILLADEELNVIKSYDVWQQKKFMGREYMGVARSSFLIDPEGKIAKIYFNVKPAEHATQVMQDLETLAAK